MIFQFIIQDTLAGGRGLLFAGTNGWWPGQPQRQSEGVQISLPPAEYDLPGHCFSGGLTSTVAMSLATISRSECRLLHQRQFCPSQALSRNWWPVLERLA